MRIILICQIFSKTVNFKIHFFKERDYIITAARTRQASDIKQGLWLGISQNAPKPLIFGLAWG